MPHKNRDEHNKYRRERRKKLKQNGITEYSLWIKPYPRRYKKEIERLNKRSKSETGLRYWRNQTELLTDGYIKRKLKQEGFNQFTEEIIQVKRLIIKTKRL